MSFSEEVLLTDICSKSNKKIFYTSEQDYETTSPVKITARQITSWTSWQYFSSVIKDIFLPQGYPDSVSSDYLEYQTWDTLQAFCSSISGTLAMSAVMKGIGVGSSAATPISAALTWLLKDGTGMVGSILFAWFKGTSFDADSKKWRLFADILNDIALFIELYIPLVMNYSVYMLIIATSLKSLVSTAGSSTRVAFITHQAIKGNIADVSAKDGSQEILTNLCAFIIGVFLLKGVTETDQVWTVMYLSIVFHLIFNYKAVRCLRMNVFNSERFCICIRTYFPTSNVPTIEQVNEWESLFLFRKIKDVKLCNFSIVLGASLRKAFESLQVNSAQFLAISALFESKAYIIMADVKNKKLYISFREDFKENDVLKSYFHALLIGISLTVLEGGKNLDVVSRSRKNSPIYRLKNNLHENVAEEERDPEKILMQAYTTCGDFIEKEFLAFSMACGERGWFLNKHLINIGDWRADWPYKADVPQHTRRVHRVNRIRKEAIRRDMNILLLN